MYDHSDFRDKESEFQKTFITCPSLTGNKRLNQILKPDLISKPHQHVPKRISQNSRIQMLLTWDLPKEADEPMHYRGNPG